MLMFYKAKDLRQRETKERRFLQGLLRMRCPEFTISGPALRDCIRADVFHSELYLGLCKGSRCSILVPIYNQQMNFYHRH